ncbi:sugar transferase [Altererythrobacter sp. B11]|uniref:sugar transferase n=1 Tax=Altererythrobacter sp. B11 TaxID=2060312 RepID=UPI000DC6FD02|nr:sugar transferase [Altererythrobacter sp. B11]BBC70938.1 sugar transferase [Altererythrobacter sp. B11]
MDLATVPLSTLTPVKSKRTLRLQLYLALLCGDLFAITLGFLLAGLVFPRTPEMFSSLGLAALVCVTYFAFAVAAEVYSKHALNEPKANRRKAFICLTYALLIAVLFFFVTKSGTLTSRLQFGVGALGGFVFLYASRSLFYRHLVRPREGSLQNELLIVDEVPFEGPDPQFMIRTRDLGLHPDLSDPGMLHRIGVAVAGFERVMVLCPPDRHYAWTLLLRGAAVDGEIILREEESSWILGLGKFNGKMTHVVSRGPLNTSNRALKRALDLAITVPVLIGLAPLLAFVAVAIKLDSRGPVLFKQDRVGRGNKLFKIMKFRSMRVEDCDSRGARSTSRTDNRITRVGSFIRKTSIDELPQLFNVLKGDMSLVGPRPHALGSLAGDALFWEVDHRYWLRHSLKPGITGLAQVRGFRGATEQRVDLERRLQADLEYVGNWSLVGELSILMRTFLVLMHRNAF